MSVRKTSLHQLAESEDQPPLIGRRNLVPERLRTDWRFDHRGQFGPFGWGGASGESRLGAPSRTVRLGMAGLQQHENSAARPIETAPTTHTTQLQEHPLMSREQFLDVHSGAFEKATLEARRQGHTVTEQALADGSIKLVVHVAGGAA